MVRKENVSSFLSEKVPYLELYFLLLWRKIICTLVIIPDQKSDYFLKLLQGLTLFLVHFLLLWVE